MITTVYVCSGSCGAIISEKRYMEGLVQCGAKTCSMKGHNFEKRFKCSKCGEIYQKEQAHLH